MLQPQTPGPVPADTVRVARAAFLKGSPLIALRDELGAVFSDGDFAALYPALGQPAYPPWRLALVTVLQFREALSDRAAADAIRARIDRKYLLVGAADRYGVRLVGPPRKDASWQARTDGGPHEADGPVFAGERGGPVEESYLRKRLRHYPELAKVQKTVTPYSLRHSFGTRLAMEGTPLYLIARLMRTSVQMIERHYAHYDPARGADHVERVFGGGGEPTPVAQ